MGFVAVRQHNRTGGLSIKHFEQRTGGGFIVALLITAALGLLAQEALAEVDFANKTVTWIVPFAKGGGSDKHARFFAPRLSAALPGRPRVEVKYLPGTASIKGANFFASDQVKPDGLTILSTSGSTQFPYLFSDPRVRYEYNDWHVLLASATGGVVYLAADLGSAWQDSMDSVLDTYFIFGSQGANRLDLVPLLAFELLGMKVEAVFGIKGRDVARTMFERGEVNVDYQTSAAYLARVKPLVAAGEAVPIMSLGILDGQGDIVRDPTFPDLPTFQEVYTQIHGRAPAGEAWEAWKAFFIAGFSAQKMVFLPGGTSAEVIEAYRKAFQAVVSSPGFSEDAEKNLGRYPHVAGEAAEVYLRRSVQIEPRLVDWVKRWLKERYRIRL